MIIIPITLFKIVQKTPLYQYIIAARNQKIRQVRRITNGQALLASIIVIYLLMSWAPCVAQGARQRDARTSVIVKTSRQLQNSGPLISFTGNDPYSKRALVIGIEGYDDNLGELRGCHEDAKQMGDMLRNSWGYPDIQIEVVTDERGNQPKSLTRGYLDRQIRNFIDRIHKNDSIVLYFSGHGTSYDKQDYLVPLGGDESKPEDTCINFNDILREIDKREPRKALIITDACRRGRQRGISKPFGTGTSQTPQTDRDFVVIRSCGPGQVSEERSDIQGGVFTRSFLEAIKPLNTAQAGQKVYYEALISLVQYKVGLYYKERNRSDRTQVPVGISSHGKIEIYSWQYLPKSPPPPPPPSLRQIEVANRNLALAMKQPDYRKVRDWIGKGANAWNIPNGGGAPRVVSNVLNWVAYMDDLDSLRLLLGRGKGVSVNTRGKDLRTPLHMAALGNARRVAPYLLRRKADTVAKTLDGREPLQLAVMHNSLDVTRILLAHDERLAGSGSGGFGTPLQIAVNKAALDMVELLLPYYPEYRVGRRNSYELLFPAVRANRKDLVLLLLKHGASPDSSHPGGWQKETLLHTAAEQPDTEMVQLLLDYDADVNAKSGLRETPLHKAVWMGHLEVVKLLVRNRADINAVANDGTPLDFAENHHQGKIKDFLLEKGAKGSK